MDPEPMADHTAFEAGSNVAPGIPRGACFGCGKPHGETGRPATADVLGPLLAFSPYTCDDLRSHDKWDPRLVELRRAAMLALRGAGYSTPAIGKLLNRDHTTVLHALGRTRRSQSRVG